ncbi:VOC family protein [Peribacillus sp. NPDC096379]|uniref:VOC family protein n=1 Tax=Peribacillus sp. NPDC096379 TaxID=3364393 RepID=UPI0037F4335F
MEEYKILPEIVKLGHVALISQNVEKSLWFFKEVLGLEETKEVDGVHYLRAWGDFEHHTLSITAGAESRIEHIAWKAKRREDVASFAALFEEAGVEVTKINDKFEVGQGEAIRFQLPSGHNFEIYYDMERPLGEGDNKSILRNQPYKAWSKGVSPRRIDHINCMTTMSTQIIADFLAEKLGFQMRETIEVPGTDQIVGAWMNVSPLAHDIAVMSDPRAKSTSEVNHLAYWLDDGQDILRAADILAEAGLKCIGPGRHGGSRALYLYVEDPGSGLRIELFTNAYLVLEPDWEPIHWTTEELDLALTLWGQPVGATDEIMTGIYAGIVKETVKK